MIEKINFGTEGNHKDNKAHHASPLFANCINFIKDYHMQTTVHSSLKMIHLVHSCLSFRGTIREKVTKVFTDSDIEK